MLKPTLHVYRGAEAKLAATSSVFSIEELEQKDWTDHSAPTTRSYDSSTRHKTHKFFPLTATNTLSTSSSMLDGDYGTTVALPWHVAYGDGQMYIVGIEQ